MKPLREKIGAFRDRLIKINDREPLAKLSLVIIIALDIFILCVVFRGLSDHTRQITSPQEYIPYECRRALIEKGWSSANWIDRLQDLVLIEYNNYSYRYQNELFDEAHLKEMHPECQRFFRKIKQVIEDQGLTALFKTRQKLIHDKEAQTEAYKKSKPVYDSTLLEDIKDKDADSDRLPSISEVQRQGAASIELLNSQISAIEKQIIEHPLTIDFWQMLEPENGDIREELVQGLRRFEFWYPLKEFAWQFIFLLPLFFIFYIWGAKSLSKGNGLQTLISSHLLVITSIPIFIKTIQLVFELIPEHFFRELFRLLKLFHLIALWHYFLIIISICAALLLIYILQKKLFDKERLMKKRLTKGQCQECGKRLPKGSSACPFCGSRQYKSCPHCRQNTFISADFCTNCGGRLD